MTQGISTQDVIDHAAAQQQADARLRRMPIDGLLRAAYALTHRMHATTDLNASADLRAQRDLIDAEIVRRTTEGA